MVMVRRRVALRSVLLLPLVLAFAAKAEVSQAPFVPPELVVPAGNQIVLSAHADGFQIYDCVADASGHLAWTFHAPLALLRTDDRHLVVLHFGGIDTGLPAGAYWESVLDGSRVHGGNVISVPNPGAIPLLRLQGVDHAGEGIFANVSFIQRLETVGGLAPNGSCGRAGIQSFVPYTATYVFYVPSLPRPDVPAGIVVPTGNDVGMIGHATGVQTYECALDATNNLSWRFRAPRADLFDDDGLFIEHFGGVDKGLPAGAWWQSVRDLSRVHAGNAVSAPNAGSIPLLRLEKLDVAGDGILSRVSFIQRLATSGGVGPTGPCSPVDARVDVPYTADYYFYRPAP
jgi:hypothetical protein